MCAQRPVKTGRLAYRSKNLTCKKPDFRSRAFSISNKKEKNKMARKKGFYERVKVHVKRIGKRVELTIILPQSASSDLFSEIKSSVRRKRARRKAALELVA
jgi:hypothetical protein